MTTATCRRLGHLTTATSLSETASSRDLCACCWRERFRAPNYKRKKLMAQLSLFAEDIRQLARPARRDIRSGDAAEAFVIAKLLKAGFDAHGARRDAPY